ncbi:MAG: DUF883 domain-containing protein [Methylomonas sp.]|jgi:ElaB/YqjD/DUF883 family membrane-anchored ribosome-binding protein
METIDKASSFAHEAIDKLAKVSNQAADTFDEKSRDVKTAEQQLLKNCNNFIRDNPATSLGIAVAAGFLLSRLLSRR